MKKIILSLLLASVTLIAADSVPEGKTGGFQPIDGAALYSQHCAMCHGANGLDSALQKSAQIAGKDAVKLALVIRAYRDQDDRDEAYTMHKTSEVMKNSTSGLSGKEIVALAKYISSL